MLAGLLKCLWRTLCSYSEEKEKRPVFDLSAKYALILSFVSISFFYGLYLPAVFFVTAICIAIQYVIDRCLLTWYYDFPNVYDDEMHWTFFRLLRYAALAFVVAIDVIACFSDY